MIFTETPKRQLVSALVTWGHWFALSNIFVAIVIAGIYLFSSALPDTVFGMLYLVANWFSHIAFLTFFGFVLLILPLCYLLPQTRLLRAWASIVAAVGLALLAFDALLYTRHGLHFSPHSAEFIRQQTDTVLAGLKSHQIIFLMVSFLIWLMFQLLVANSLWHRIERLQKLRWGLPVSSTFVALFVFSHIAHIWADAKLYEPIVKQDNMFPLSYPATAKTLMSKYGMLDMEAYRNKKQLKFETQLGGVRYPKSNAICSVKTEQKILLAFLSVNASEQSIDEELLKSLNLQMLPTHFNFSTDEAGIIKSALYGLPQIYHSQLSNKKPLIVDLLHSAKLPVTAFSQNSNNKELFSYLSLNPTETMQEFFNVFNNETDGMFVVDMETEYLSKLQLNDQVQIVLVSKSKEQQVFTATNLPISTNMMYSSHEDLASSLIETLGCNLSNEIHSTGQSLITPQRDWIIASQGGKIVIIHNGLLTEIDPSGNYLLTDLEGNPQSNVELNIPLLGQAIKLLSSFNK